MPLSVYFPVRDLPMSCLSDSQELVALIFGTLRSRADPGVDCDAYRGSHQKSPVARVTRQLPVIVTYCSI
jgi:hypothetical protein